MNYLIFVTFTLICTTSVYATTNSNSIVFRLDDVQDYYLSAAQQAIINLFKEEEIPVSIGIIAANFGKDYNMVNYVKDGLDLDEWDLEVCNHGWNHVYYDQLPLLNQTDYFQKSVAATPVALGGKIDKLDCFYPPMNAYNADTITAMKANGFKTLSSMVSMDHEVYPFYKDGLWRFPIGAWTAEQDAFYQYRGITADQTWALIQTQMQRDGYAAVMMHPQEFSVPDSNNAPTPAVNQNMIAQLRILIQRVKDAGYYFTTFTELPAAFDVTAPTGSRVTTSVKITSGSITSGKISTGSVTSSSVTSGKVTSGATQLSSGSAATTSPNGGGVGLTSGMEESTTGLEITTGVEETTGSSCAPGSVGCECSEGDCEGENVCDGNNICTSMEPTVSSSDASTLIASGLAIFIAAFL